MKRYFLVMALFCFFTNAFSQDQQLITVNQLQDRISRGEDTTYVINFWATWCVPCLKEIPHFEKLQAAYKEQKIKVIFISVDFKSRLHTAVLPYVKKNKIRSEVFLLNETDQQSYIDRIDKNWSGAIPATLFIKAGQRKFLEKEFTNLELEHQIKTFN